ncbi:hypothetical protein DLREEDagrD3_28400 [Denitratisoma sp. agr-D3]
MSQQINLYDPALRPRRDLLSGRNLVLAATVIVALTIVAAALADVWRNARQAEARQAAEQLQAAQARVEQLAQRAANLKPDPALQAEIDRVGAQVAARAEVLALLEKGMTAPENGYAEILRGLARRTLNGLWLTGVEVAPGAGAMELSGRTLDRSLVAEYLRRLNDEKIFAGRSFSGLKLAQPQAEEGGPARAPAYLEFSLTAGVDNGTGERGKGQEGPRGAKEKSS